MSDEVDAIVAAWRHERPDLDVSPLLVLSRISRLAAVLDERRANAFVEHGLQLHEFDVLSAQKPSSIPEPTRSLLLNARDGEMLPPTVSPGSVELWAVCGRKVVKADDQKREVAENSLRQKEFDILAKKHLKDLRQDAAIEYRDGRGS